MDTMPSSEFRKCYATLVQPVQVTVNGHVIGEWVPVSHARYQTVQEAKATVAAVRQDAGSVRAERYDQRPVRHVPKVGKRS